MKIKYKGIFLASLVFVFSGVAYAWTGPTVAPTGGNVPSPINVTPFTQIKTGGLQVANLWADRVSIGTVVNSSAFTAPKFCIGTTCITSWTLGDNLGNHIATKALVMSNFNITNIGKATGVSTVAGDSSNTLVTKDYVLSKKRNATPLYNCPNYTTYCATTPYCTGQVNSPDRYCYSSRPSGSMGCTGCGCYNYRQYSCTPVW